MREMPEWFAVLLTIAMLFGLIAWLFWQAMKPQSEFRQEYPRPRVRNDAEKAQTTNAALPAVRREALAVQNQPGEREIRLADSSAQIARSAVDRHGIAKSREYLAALREKYRTLDWHTDQAHALGAVINQLSAEIERKEREL